MGVYIFKLSDNKVTVCEPQGDKFVCKVYERSGDLSYKEVSKKVIGSNEIKRLVKDLKSYAKNGGEIDEFLL